mgnify:CR=1 FL=1
MKTNKYGCTLAVQEHLLSGDPITRLEALVLYGVCNLPQVISGMRKTGLIIKSRALPYIAAVKRVTLTPRDGLMLHKHPYSEIAHFQG